MGQITRPSSGAHAGTDKEPGKHDEHDAIIAKESSYLRGEGRLRRTHKRGRGISGSQLRQSDALGRGGRRSCEFAGVRLWWWAVGLLARRRKIEAAGSLAYLITDLLQLPSPRQTNHPSRHRCAWIPSTVAAHCSGHTQPPLIEAVSDTRHFGATHSPRTSLPPCFVRRAQQP